MGEEICVIWLEKFRGAFRGPLRRYERYQVYTMARGREKPLEKIRESWTSYGAAQQILGPQFGPLEELGFCRCRAGPAVRI